MSKLFFIIFSCFISYTALACEAHKNSAKPEHNLFHGFNLNGEAINPVCINKMQPLESDSGLIIKSIILEQCQNSNWAYHSSPIVSDKEGAGVQLEDTFFKYQVLGRTTNNHYVLFYAGNVATYRIYKEAIQADLLKPETKEMHVLKVMGKSYVPCFKSGSVKGNTLTISKNVTDENNKCLDKLETVEYVIK